MNQDSVADESSQLASRTRSTSLSPGSGVELGLYDTLNQEEARDGEIVRLTDTLPGFVLFCYS